MDALSELDRLLRYVYYSQALPLSLLRVAGETELERALLQPIEDEDFRSESFANQRMVIDRLAPVTRSRSLYDSHNSPETAPCSCEMKSFACETLRDFDVGFRLSPQLDSNTPVFALNLDVSYQISVRGSAYQLIESSLF